MDSNSGYFIVLEGIDGSGKTTICKRITEILVNYNVVFCSRKDIYLGDPIVNREMKNVAKLMWKDDLGKYDHVLPANYYIHLHALWYTLLSLYIVKPKLSTKTIVITDGWYYKFFAKLFVQNFESKYLNSIFSNVVKPNHVILIDVDIKSSWNRKSNYTAYELGSHHGYENLNKESFVDFQSKVQVNLNLLAKDNNWDVFKMETDNIDENSILIASLIIKHLDEG